MDPEQYADYLQKPEVKEFAKRATELVTFAQTNGIDRTFMFYGLVWDFQAYALQKFAELIKADSNLKIERF